MPIDTNMISIICILLTVFLFIFSKNREKFLGNAWLINLFLLIIGAVNLLIYGLKGIRFSGWLATLPNYCLAYVLTILFLTYYNWLDDLITKRKSTDLWTELKPWIFWSVLFHVCSIAGVLFFNYHWYQIVVFGGNYLLLFIIYQQYFLKLKIFSSFRINAIIIFAIDFLIALGVYHFKNFFEGNEYNSFKDFLSHRLIYFFRTWFYISFCAIYFNAYPKKVERTYIQTAMTVYGVLLILSVQHLRDIIAYIPFLKK